MNFCFLAQTTPYAKIFKILFRKFTWRTVIDVVVFKFCEIWLTGNRQNRALLTWPKTKRNFGYHSNCRNCADRAQNLPEPARNSVLTVFQISSKSVHVRRSYSQTCEHRFCPVEYFHYRLFELITIMTIHSSLVTVMVDKQKIRKRNNLTKKVYNVYIH